MASSSSSKAYLRGVQLHAAPGGEGRREGQLRLGAGDDLLHVVRLAAQVQGHGHHSRPDASEEDDHPVGGVGAPDDCPVALLQAAGLEQRRHAPRLLPQPPVAPAAVAEGGLQQQRVPRPVPLHGAAAETPPGSRPRADSRCRHGSRLPPTHAAMIPRPSPRPSPRGRGCIGTHLLLLPWREKVGMRGNPPGPPSP